MGKSTAIALGFSIISILFADSSVACNPAMWNQAVELMPQAQAMHSEGKALERKAYEFGETSSWYKSLTYLAEAKTAYSLAAQKYMEARLAWEGLSEKCSGRNQETAKKNVRVVSDTQLGFKDNHSEFLERTQTRVAAIAFRAVEDSDFTLLEHIRALHSMSMDELVFYKDKKGVGRDGLSPLHLAARKNNVEMIDYLVKGGARLEDRSEVSEMRFTPLQFCAFYGILDSFFTLVALGADVNALVEVPSGDDEAEVYTTTDILIAVYEGHLDRLARIGATDSKTIIQSNYLILGRLSAGATRGVKAEVRAFPSGTVDELLKSHENRLKKAEEDFRRNK